MSSALSPCASTSRSGTTASKWCRCRVHPSRRWRRHHRGMAVTVSRAGRRQRCRNAQCQLPRSARCRNHHTGADGAATGARRPAHIVWVRWHNYSVGCWCLHTGSTGTSSDGSPLFASTRGTWQRRVPVLPGYCRRCDPVLRAAAQGDAGVELFLAALPSRASSSTDDTTAAGSDTSSPILLSASADAANGVVPLPAFGVLRRRRCAPQGADGALPVRYKLDPGRMR